MRRLFADRGMVLDVHEQHPRLVHKAQTLIVRAYVGPVDVEQVDGIVGHSDLSQNDVERILGNL